MSRRNTYLIGAAAIIVGIALIVIALLLSSGEDSGGGATGTGTAPSKDTGQAPAGSTAEGSALAKRIAGRQPARAPRFSLAVVQGGSPPAQVRGPLTRLAAGDRLDIAQSGTPVVLHVWSSDCAPCRADARLVQATWERWGRRGVAFVGLSVDERAQDALRFARQYGLTYPIAHDVGARTARAYGVRSLPETFFISATGSIVGHVAGGPSVRQMEFGAAAARSARPIGSEQGSGSVPLR